MHANALPIHSHRSQSKSRKAHLFYEPTSCPRQKKGKRHRVLHALLDPVLAGQRRGLHQSPHLDKLTVSIFLFTLALRPIDLFVSLRGQSLNLRESTDVFDVAFFVDGALDEVPAAFFVGGNDGW